MPRLKDLTGKVFGRLKVQKHVGFRHGNTLWECLCDPCLGGCGSIKIVMSGNFKRTKSCGCLNSETVIARQTTHGGTSPRNQFGLRSLWMRAKRAKSGLSDEFKNNFQLFEHWATSIGFKSGENSIRRKFYSVPLGRDNFTIVTIKRTGSGPSKLYHMPDSQNPLEMTVRNIFKQYKAGSSSRNLFWDLSFAEVSKLALSDCFYCGQSSQLPFLNGIDRLDSQQGYSKENCVASCKRCNYGKLDLSPDEFLAWIEKVYKHKIEKEVVEKAV